MASVLRRSYSIERIETEPFGDNCNSGTENLGWPRSVSAPPRGQGRSERWSDSDICSRQSHEVFLKIQCGCGRIRGSRMIPKEMIQRFLR